MRREARRLAAALALVIALPRLLAESLPSKPEPSPSERDVISAALCGADNQERVRAEALDEMDVEKNVPDNWRKLKFAQLRHWLAAPPCAGKTIAEMAKLSRRRQTLAKLQSRLQEAQATALVEASLAQFHDWQPVPNDLPESVACSGCAALRKAADEVIAASRLSRNKKIEEEQIGAVLDAAHKRESLIDKVCAAMPSPDARGDIEERFRYYSWTANGARLLEVAAWFGRPEVVAACKER
jgi:hypothetical protein